MTRYLYCVARERDDVWEGICLDLDIALQGASLEEVRSNLGAAVTSYFEDALSESEPHRSALLNRRAPLLARASWLWPFIVRTLFATNRDGDSRIGFQVACPA